MSDLRGTNLDTSDGPVRADRRNRFIGASPRSGLIGCVSRRDGSGQLDRFADFYFGGCWGDSNARDRNVSRLYAFWVAKHLFLKRCKHFIILRPGVLNRVLTVRVRSGGSSRSEGE